MYLTACNPHMSRRTNKGPYGSPVCCSSNAHTQVPGCATDVQFYRKLPQGLFYMSANSKGSGEPAFMCRPARALADRLRKFPFRMCWLMLSVKQIL